MPRASLWRALLAQGDVAVLAIPAIVGSEHPAPIVQTLAS
jgi:hypothetical protein